MDISKKQARSSKPLISEVQQRWSPRAFNGKAIADEDLKTLFEAARWAASSGNLQPWRFLVAKKGSETFNNILEGLAPGNVAWAKNAPVLLINIARKTRTTSKGEEKPNAHSWHDVGLAMGNLSAQATSMGIYLHHMGGIEPKKLEETLEVNTELFEVVTAVALGYFSQDAMENLPENQQASELAERTRKPLNEIVFEGKFKQPATWL